MTYALLRRFSIRGRIIALALLTVSALVLLGGIAVQGQRAAMMELEHQRVADVVRTAAAILGHYQALQRNGEMSEAEAQAEARKALADVRYSNGDYIWINDLQQRMVMHPVSPELDGKDMSGHEDPTGMRIFAAFVRVAREQGSGFVKYQWPLPGSAGAADKLAFVQLFEPWDWVIGSGIYLERVYAEINAQTWRMAASAGAVLVVLGGLMLLISGSIIAPLNAMVARIRGLYGERVDLTVRMPTDGHDELSTMAGSLNGLLDTVQNMVREVKQANQELTGAAGTLATVADRTRGGMKRQQEDTEQLAAAMNQMTATVHEVARNSTNTASSTREADQHTHAGRRVVEDTMGAISELATELERSEGVVRALAERADAIGQVLEVINGVAEQTNLLALNAAIEAARAGDQGRGFSVVADEVRVLAQRTQDSTQQIQEIIQELQEASRQAVDSMQRNGEAAERTVRDSSRAGDALNAISAAVATIKDMSAQIASAAEEQAATAEEINRSMTNIRDATGVAAAGTQDTSAAVVQLHGMTQRLEALLGRLRA